ncbi:MAG: tetratricopeptide repeat protein [Planctomycetota bacterium]
MMNTLQKRIFIQLPALFLCLSLVCAGDENPVAAQGEQKPKKSSSAILALEARLKALEKEEEALSALSGKLAEGQVPTTAELWESWLPPAIYLVDLSNSDSKKELTGAAAGNVREILETKDVELEQLYALKTEMEGGNREDTPVLEELDVLGIESPDKVLEKEMKELDAMRSQLQRLRFQDRFQRSADLGEAMEDDQALLQQVSLSDPETRQPVPEGVRVEEESEGDPRRITVNLLKLAETCYKAGRFEKALQVFSDIDSATHNEGDRILYMMGRCSENTGDLNAARKYYQEVGKVYPNSFWAKEAKFAITLVGWKEEIGEVRGLPPEVMRVLGYGKAQDNTNGTGRNHE